ncbi:MAG TPA: hypothetical protein VD867_05780 [Burkholderiales bacterium]|nr:hypothetical protein [Burkholderiales bacterium]
MDRAPAAVMGEADKRGQRGSDYNGYERRVMSYVTQEDFDAFRKEVMPMLTLVKEIHGHTRIVCKLARWTFAAIAAAVPVAAGIAATGRIAGFW